MSRRSPKPLLLAWFLLAVALTRPHPAAAWGNEGHRVIALIAEHYLDPTVRAKVATLLATDADTLTGHDIADEATWADKYRDSDRDTTKIRYEATWRWHFVDIELAQPDLASACFDHPPLPPGIAASQGPPQACVVDKIDAGRMSSRRSRSAPRRLGSAAIISIP
jgi:nuclease S1